MDYRRTAPGWLHPSDRGSTYAREDYRTALTQHGFEASMSRKGNGWDNAVAESFFATIKGELIDHETYTTRAEAEASIGDYIENSSIHKGGTRRSTRGARSSSN